jgi:cellulose synthase/poly-beta-1,6-N-acetylglucosamine synthase-like glycosyltransferase
VRSKENPLLILLIVFVLAALIQLVYFSLTLSLFHKKIPAGSGAAIPVSLIVCAHDEEQNLRRLIPELLQQDYPSLEVIIVNDRSNDNTYDYLLEQTAADPRLKMVNVKETPPHVNGKKFALTLGIRAASHEWIVLTDADCEPVSRTWVSKMAEQFSDETQFVLGYSPYQQSEGFLNLFIRFESLVTALQYLSFAMLKNPYMGVGRNLAYRKSLFLDKKGFNNFLHITGGDDDLFVNQYASARNTRVQFAPESVVYSVPKTSWGDFLNQKIRHLSVGKLYKFKHRFLLGMLTLSWIITLFVGVPLLFITPYYYVVAGVLVLRWLLIVLTINNFAKKSGVGFALWVIPVLDFLYPIYYISTGLVTLFTRKVRWKK